MFIYASRCGRHQLYVRQPGDLGVLRGVVEGVAEEARTLGFASLAFASYAFIGVALLFVL